MDIAVVGVAVNLQLDGDGRTVKDARVALASVAPTPIRSPQAEQALIGSQLNDETLRRAGEGAAADARPISDVRATADYRRELLKVYTRRVGQIAYQRARGS
jgi:carbon-monoxide dehydrogenase medium subunit